MGQWDGKHSGSGVKFHAFRHVAMQIFSAGEFGLDASEGALRAIAFGDLVSAALALAALWMIRTRSTGALAVTWVFAIVASADLISATAIGVNESLVDTASNVSWVILAFYVPFLWVTIVMVFWQLLARRSEVRGSPASAAHPQAARRSDAWLRRRSSSIAFAIVNVRYSICSTLQIRHSNSCSS